MTPRILAHRAASTLALLLAAGGCGGPLFSAEVVVDRFCFTQHLTGLPQLPPVAGSVTAPPVSVPLQLPPGLRSHASTAVLRLLDGSVTATTAGTTLDGIDGLDLLVQPPSGGAVTAASYARGGATNVTAMPLSGHGADVADLLQSGALEVSLSMAVNGQPKPAAAWDADLTLCFYGKTVVSYF
jgi:hypothetical protein